MNQELRNLNDIHNPHSLLLTLKTPFHFTWQLQTASLLVCAHAAPCLFNENTKAEE